MLLDVKEISKKVDAIKTLQYQATYEAFDIFQK